MPAIWPEPTNPLSTFKREYEADVVTSERRYRRLKPLNMSKIQSSCPDDIIDYMIPEIEDVEMIDIVMPKENLARLLSHQETALYRQIMHEHELRTKYESLNKAWEQYQLILALVDDPSSSYYPKF